jgi:hypothetical protein
MDLERLTRQDFEPRQGSIFRLIPAAGAPRDLVLVQVESLAPENAPPGSGREPFSLVFRDPGAPGFYHQAIYRLEHPDLGALELFLVPIGPDAQGMRYQAVFT